MGLISRVSSRTYRKRKMSNNDKNSDRLEFIRPEPSFKEFIIVKKDANMGNNFGNRLRNEYRMASQDPTYWLDKDKTNNARENLESDRYKEQLETYDKISQKQEKRYYDSILRNYS